MRKMKGFAAVAQALVVLCMVAWTHQASTGCKYCSSSGKEERKMFRVHSDACLATSKATSAQIEGLLRGELIDAPELKSHVYCVLVKCKVIGKDGKLQKAAVLDKVAVRGNGKDTAKILENCSEHQVGNTPEELTWNLFRCAYEKKAMLFDYMPTSPSAAQDN